MTRLHGRQNTLLVLPTGGSLHSQIRSPVCRLWLARSRAELIERNCCLAERFAAGLRRAGHTILNDVVLNQVLVSFGEAEITRRVIENIQTDGCCWCGGTQWQGHTAMRISVSSWATTETDVDHSLEAIVRIAQTAKNQESERNTI
jgi:threonine aldolase